MIDFLGVPCFRYGQLCHEIQESLVAATSDEDNELPEEFLKLLPKYKCVDASESTEDIEIERLYSL